MHRGPLIIPTRIVRIVVLFHKGWDSTGAHVALLVNGHIFFQFSLVLQPSACLHRYPPCV